MHLRRPGRRGLLLGLMAAVAVVAFTVYPMFRHVASAAKDNYESLEAFSMVLATVRKHYVEEVDTQELIEGAMKGMISSLDPHSAYLTPDMLRELRIDTRGEFGGLGIEITMREDVLTIVTPIDGTPAFRAGAQPGDKIILIDGEVTREMSLQEAVDKMRGAPGTEVTLSIRRKDQRNLIELEITREIIHVQSVRSPQIFEDRFGYLRVTNFQQDTAKELSEALTQLETDSDGGLDGLILDLRYNPGGLLDQAVDVSDLFLDAGLIVSTNGRLESQRDKWLASSNGTAKLRPMVVLVNGGSASASEIVAGALKDHQRALVLGTQTFGKGSVQTILSLPGDAAVRLTTARYYTPSGRSIHERGIEPDVVVEQTLPEAEDDESAAAAGDEAAAEKEPAEPSIEELSRDTIDVERDPQLKRALALLDGWAGDIEAIGGVAGFQLDEPSTLAEAASAPRPQEATSPH